VGCCRCEEKVATHFYILFLVSLKQERKIGSGQRAPVLFPSWIWRSEKKKKKKKREKNREIGYHLFLAKKKKVCIFLWGYCVIVRFECIGGLCSQ
jgi:hypothetical protein